MASHPAVVAPPACSASCCRLPGAASFRAGCDVVVRNSIFRAGYELLYTPLAEATKRSAKSLIDVACRLRWKGRGRAADPPARGLWRRRTRSRR